MAYGQTGSGKTYTMLGDTGASGNPNEVNPSNNTEFDPRDFSTAGIIPRAVDAIFREIENDTSPESKYLVRVSYLQIYNEVGNHAFSFYIHSFIHLSNQSTSTHVHTWGGSQKVLFFKRGGVHIERPLEIVIAISTSFFSLCVSKLLNSDQV